MSPIRSFWFRASSILATVRIVVDELGKTRLRILARLKEPFPRLDIRLQCCPHCHNPGNLERENSFLRACIGYSQQQLNDIPWCGALDLRMASQAFHGGALW